MIFKLQKRCFFFLKLILKLNIAGRNSVTIEFLAFLTPRKKKKIMERMKIHIFKWIPAVKRDGSRCVSLPSFKNGIEVSMQSLCHAH